MKAELLVDSRCLLGERQVWDEREGTLWWVDIDGKRLHRYHMAEGRHEQTALPAKVGSFALREAGGLSRRASTAGHCAIRTAVTGTLGLPIRRRITPDTASMMENAMRRAGSMPELIRWTTSRKLLCT